MLRFLRPSIVCVILCAACASSSSSDAPTSPGGAPPVDPSHPAAPTCPAPGPTETLVTEPGQFISKLAVDDTHVYYAIETMDGSPDSSTIKRVALTGGAPEELAKVSRLIELGVAGDTVYFTAQDTERQHLYSLAKTGGSPTKVSGDDESPARIVIGPSGDVFYDSYPDERIMRRKSGGSPTVVAPAPRQYLGLFRQDGDSLFVTQVPAVGENGVEGQTSLYVHSLATGQDKTLYGPFEKDYLRTLAVDDKYVYVGHGQFLARLPKEGGDAVLIPTDAEATLINGVPSDGVFELAVDADALYWLEMKLVSSPTEGALVRKKKNGAPREELATGGLPKSLQLDACHVYWTSQENHAESIYRRGK